MKFRIIAATAAVALLPAAAQAEDFLGGRIGIIGGWDNVSIDAENIDGRGTDIDKDYDGATFGIVTGYHWPLGDSAIIGVGTSTMLSNNSKTFNLPSVTPGPANSVKIEAGRDLEVHVKAGVIVNESALLYAKVGYANAKVTAKGTVGGVAFKESDTGSGLRLGVGTELSINDKFSFVAEYRFTNYSNDLDRNQLVAGFAYKF